MVETENVPYGTVVQNDSIYSMSGTERRYERMVKRNSYSLMVLKDGTYRWYKKTVRMEYTKRRTHGWYKKDGTKRWYQKPETNKRNIETKQKQKNR